MEVASKSQNLKSQDLCCSFNGLLLSTVSCARCCGGDQQANRSALRIKLKKMHPSGHGEEISIGWCLLMTVELVDSAQMWLHLHDAECVCIIPEFKDPTTTVPRVLEM
jgi:hypothetical protein